MPSSSPKNSVFTSELPTIIVRGWLIEPSFFIRKIFIKISSKYQFTIININGVANARDLDKRAKICYNISTFTKDLIKGDLMKELLVDSIRRLRGYWPVAIPYVLGALSFIVGRLIVPGPLRTIMPIAAVAIFLLALLTQVVYFSVGFLKRPPSSPFPLFGIQPLLLSSELLDRRAKCSAYRPE